MQSPKHKQMQTIFIFQMLPTSFVLRLKAHLQAIKCPHFYMYSSVSFSQFILL